MPYSVQSLIEGRGEPICVRLNDPVQRALRLMSEHDFSQLPVVAEEKKPLGMVTHESILRALNNFGVKIEDLLVSNAVVQAQKSRLDEDLFDLFDRLQGTNAVLIVNGEEKLIGIVTTYDCTEYLRRRAEDMMLVEDIENMVKDLVLVAFTDDTGEVDQEKLAVAVREITSSKQTLMSRYRNALQHYLKLGGQKELRVNQQWFKESFSHLSPREKPKEFDKLTLYEYTELLLHKSRWTLYHQIFNLKPEAVRKLLGGVRETRNALAHFRGEISSTQRDQLKFCVDWLVQHPVDRLRPSMIGIPVSWPVSSEEAELEHHTARETVSSYQTSPTFNGDVLSAEETIGPGDSRYALLAIWLQSQPLNRNRVQLTFQDVEGIIGGTLPVSARRHRAWWANDSSHIQSQQWLDVGWRVSQINMTDERVTFARIKEREKAYIKFFSALQKSLRQKIDFPLKEISPSGRHSQIVTSLPKGGPQCLYFAFSFTHNRRFRVQLYIDTTDQEKNKRIFDQLYADRDMFEETLGKDINWERLDEKLASRIALYHPGVITDDKGALAHLKVWAVDAMVRFYEVFAEPANQALISAEQSVD